MRGANSSLILVFCVLLAATTSARADSVYVGEAAPGFELRDQNGDLQSLEDYRDQWVALYFYPKDQTPGCTTEACEFRDNIFAFKKLNCQILGVSLDDSASHKEFAEMHGLPFPLLADTTGSTADAYGVKTTMFGLTVAKRETFLIDPQGFVVKHYKQVDPESHSQQILNDLAELQKSGES